MNEVCVSFRMWPLVHPLSVEKANLSSGGNGAGANEPVPLTRPLMKCDGGIVAL